MKRFTSDYSLCQYRYSYLERTVLKRGWSFREIEFQIISVRGLKIMPFFLNLVNCRAVKMVKEFNINFLVENFQFFHTLLVTVEK